MSSRKKKVLLVTEYLNPPFDEGIKKTAYQLYRTLAERYEVRVLCRVGNAGDVNVVPVRSNKLFLESRIRRQFREYGPDAVIYLPFASATFAGFLRSVVIKGFGRGARYFMVALQPKPLKGWQWLVVRVLNPGPVLTPSPALEKSLKAMNIRHSMVPLWTDTEKFSPMHDPSAKKALRKKYGLPEDAYIISHMGHINEGRNLEALLPLQQEDTQVVIVESSSTPKDSIGPAALRKALQGQGIRIISDYIKDIEEIYQLSDLYVFPVTSKTGSIGLPLSILEARACGTPVLSTDFGSVRQMLGDDGGNIRYASPEGFRNALGLMRQSGGQHHSTGKIEELNAEFFNTIRIHIEGTH